MPLKIREFNDNDINGIYKVEMLSFGRGAYSYEMIDEMLHDKNSITLVLDNNNIIGYATAVKLNSSSMDVESIAVIPEYQGHGYGKLLLSSLEDKMRGLGYLYSILEVRSMNYRAISMYKKNGYREIEYIKNYYEVNDPGGRDAIRMIKSLH
ncbi:ribosomal protein S18-alanine N-acetyltransferase [Picrophilus oshimae]|uniref:Acetyltransferase n=1 Tax=Picrophilus torridus (strain ATCC 700027 / DSM 9790 / JCM 10055 / NBRC 100828 / KAW 2/3) TaxID=1122961 RepID=Q6KYX6_PICTO|nr:ribosomal protein S18-alanine N-acetyltransferase [Picrophilus oshimae]AAT44076.1 acetyltransferase [Picrophilus oshimae DSM 9789]